MGPHHSAELYKDDPQTSPFRASSFRSYKLPPTIISAYQVCNSAALPKTGECPVLNKSRSTYQVRQVTSGLANMIVSVWLRTPLKPQRRSSCIIDLAIKLKESLAGRGVKVAIPLGSTTPGCRIGGSFRFIRGSTGIPFEVPIPTMVKESTASHPSIPLHRQTARWQRR